MTDLEKYVLEQANIEVEHTRSWPTKILAFYIAINAGIVTTLFSLTGRTSNPLYIPRCLKIAITFAIFSLLVWAWVLLARNHKSYLQHRNIQVSFQQVNQEELRKTFVIPSPWLVKNDEGLFTRWQGWGFYLYQVVLVAGLGITGVWAS